MRGFHGFGFEDSGSRIKVSNFGLRVQSGSVGVQSGFREAFVGICPEEI